MSGLEHDLRRNVVVIGGLDHIEQAFFPFTDDL